MIWNRQTFFRLPCEKQTPQSSTSSLMEHGWSSSTVNSKNFYVISSPFVFLLSSFWECCNGFCIGSYGLLLKNNDNILLHFLKDGDAWWGDIFRWLNRFVELPWALPLWSFSEQTLEFSFVSAFSQKRKTNFTVLASARDAICQVTPAFICGLHVSAFKKYVMA